MANNYLIILLYFDNHFGYFTNHVYSCNTEFSTSKSIYIVIGSKLLMRFFNELYATDKWLLGLWGIYKFAIAYKRKIKPTSRKR